MESLTFGNITGVNELLNPELLSPQEVPYFIDGVLNRSSSGLNAYKRGAWRRNTSFNAGGSTITGLKQLLDGLGNPYWVGYLGTVLQYYNAGWNNVKTGLTTSLSFKFVRYNDYNIITNGTDELFTIGGTLFANVRNLEIDRPVVTNIATQHINSAAGSLDASSQYRYILVYASDNGDFSPPSIPISHYESVTRQSTNATEKALYLYNLPVSSDGRVTKRYLFRTEGDGETYYLRKILDNIQTDFEDDMADADLDFSLSVTYINVPMLGKHIIVHKDRLFIGNTKYEDLNVYEPVHVKIKGSTTTKTNSVGLSVTYEDGEVFTCGTPSVASTTPSLDANSTYKYRLEFVDIFGRRTGYQEIQFSTDATSYNYYTLTHIPEANIGAANKFNTQCYTKRLWRTTADTDNFFLLDTLRDDNTDPYTGSTGLIRSYQDSTTDVVLAGNTAWTAVGTTQQVLNPVSIAFSEIGTPTVIPLENYREVFADEGGEITGLFDDNNGVLIFKDRAIFKLYTDGSPVNWRLVKLIDGIGCSDPETIAQIDNTYIFKDKNRIYQFNSGGEIKEISTKFRTSIERILTVKEATMNNQWYWLLCTVSAGTIVFVYNRELETWFTFTRAGGNCITLNKFGADYSADTDIYTNYGAYIVNYSTGSQIDNESGSNVDVGMVIHSKHFRFPEGITKARLRKLFVNFYGWLTKATSFQLYDPESTNTHTYTPTATGGWQTLRSDVTGNLIKTRKLQIRISGVGVQEFNSARVDYRTIKEGFGE